MSVIVAPDAWPLAMVCVWGSNSNMCIFLSWPVIHSLISVCIIRAEMSRKTTKTQIKRMKTTKNMNKIC